MRYPNLRYGNPTEFRYYALPYGDDIASLARVLRRDERTVRDWLSGRQRVPFWVPELMRLRRLEADLMMRRSSYLMPAALGVVTPAGELERRRTDVKKPQPLTALRLDDFDKAISFSVSGTGR